jgi:hypothetical protein
MEIKSEDLEEYNHAVRNAVVSIKGIFAMFDQSHIVKTMTFEQLQKIDDASKKISRILNEPE